jgi:hypothetical protein
MILIRTDPPHELGYDDGEWYACGRVALLWSKRGFAFGQQRLRFSWLYDYGWDIMGPELDTYRGPIAQCIVELFEQAVAPLPDDCSREAAIGAWRLVCQANGWDGLSHRCRLDNPLETRNGAR